MLLGRTCDPFEAERWRWDPRVPLLAARLTDGNILPARHRTHHPGYDRWRVDGPSSSFRNGRHVSLAVLTLPATSVYASGFLVSYQACLTVPPGVPGPCPKRAKAVENGESATQHESGLRDQNVTKIG